MIPRIDPTDPANMTAEERMTEVGSILAEGVLRLAGTWQFPQGMPRSFTQSNPWNLSETALSFLLKQALMDTVVNAAGEAENGDLR